MMNVLAMLLNNSEWVNKLHISGFMGRKKNWPCDLALRNLSIILCSITESYNKIQCLNDSIGLSSVFVLSDSDEDHGTSPHVPQIVEDPLWMII